MGFGADGEMVDTKRECEFETRRQSEETGATSSCHAGTARHARQQQAAAAAAMVSFLMVGRAAPQVRAVPTQPGSRRALVLPMVHPSQVGFLDIDICGPSQPRVLGTAEEKVHSSGAGWSPVYVSDNLAVMSVGFLLNSADDAVIWKGPKKDVIDEVVFKHVAVDEVALLDVRKEITFCRKVNIPIIGLVENMTTFVCPKCKTKTAVFPATTGM
ncbi:hypothetical protein O3P69_016301 [Scylla paramamosain]|uniref:Uncharacterized protein n=1 Tax=Scylla paramamosain TaxID=85552 RepID=A0AAW0SA08_SCYPA